MAVAVAGRRTHAHTGDLTIFLIGMRINRLWRPDAWVPVLAAAESVSDGVPVMGLAAATSVQEVTGRLDHARSRLAG